MAGRAFRLVRVLVAVCTMVAGTAGVVGAVVVMNAAAPPGREAAGAKEITFEVKRRQRPKVTRRIQAQKPQPRPRQVPRAPLPTVGVDISGIDFGIPSLGDAALSGVTDALLGDSKAALESMVMTDRSVDQKPRAVARVEPDYPPRARARGVTGHVVFKLLIDTSGRVADLEVVESVPAGVFDDAASAAVQQWRFSPARYQGRAVRIRSRLKVSFELG